MEGIQSRRAKHEDTIASEALVQSFARPLLYEGGEVSIRSSDVEDCTYRVSIHTCVFGRAFFGMFMSPSAKLIGFGVHPPHSQTVGRGWQKEGSCKNWLFRVCSRLVRSMLPKYIYVCVCVFSLAWS